MLPTDTSLFDDLEENSCWMIWRNFRTLSGNSKLLHIGLYFTENIGDEFLCDYNIQKWLTEPVNFS